MARIISLLAFSLMLFFCSCAKQESSESSKPNPEAPAAAQPAAGPHASVQLKDGSKVPGTIVASSATDMVVAGDDGIERKIPLEQVKSVVYEEVKPKPRGAQARGEASAPNAQGPQPRAVTTKTYELQEGSELSVRTDEAIDSATAAEGQTFDVQVTRDALDANGDVVIPRGSKCRAIIKSASKGDRFHGASDLMLDLQSVSIGGKRYTIDTAEITQKGKDGVGANKRTAVYTGGGAAVGAIIGAIAGGGKGAAIGAGAGAGAGALTQILTKGGSIKVPAETVLTFKLDKPLRVTVAQ